MDQNSSQEVYPSLILLHGLGAGAWSMCCLAARFRRIGYNVEVLSYRSRGQSLSQMTDEIQTKLPESFKGRFNIVAHSLGGLVAYELAKRLGSRSVEKVVMLGTPFLGTSLAGSIANSRMCRFIYGPIWHDLVPEVRRQQDVRIEGIEMGMIAGVVPGSQFFPGGPTDGLVPLTSTKGSCFSQCIEIAGSHAALLISRSAALKVAAFLRFGRF